MAAEPNRIDSLSQRHLRIERKCQRPVNRHCHALFIRPQRFAGR